MSVPDLLPGKQTDLRVPGYGVTMKDVHAVRVKLPKCLTDNAAIWSVGRDMTGTAVAEYMREKQGVKLEVLQILECLNILKQRDGTLKGWARFTSSEGLDNAAWAFPPEME